MIRWNEVNKKDVIISSFPRSGNTWLRYLMSDILLQLHGFSTENGLPIHPIKIIPDMHSNSLDEVDKRIYVGFYLIKSHHHFQNRCKKAICLVRKAEDALVSYYHFKLRYPKTHKQALSGPDEFSLANIDKWIANVSSWLAAFLHDNCEISFLTYKDLHLDAFNQLQKIFAFLKISVSANLIHNAIHNQSFEQLSKKENLSNFHQGEPFFRKGKNRKRRR